MKKIVPPILPSELTVVCDFIAMVEGEERMEGVSFTELQHEENESYDLHVNESAFLRCSFAGSRLINGNYVDVIFSGCDFSNCDLSKSAFRRVSFLQCKLMGADFVNCFLKDVRFEDCQMGYVNLADTKVQQSGFFDCRMPDSIFLNCQLEALFHNSELTSASFQKTPLTGIDFTSCRIDGLAVTLPDLHGLRVSALQAVGLSRLLGLEVAE